MRGTFPKSFSIRWLLFVTFVVAAFLAAIRNPSDAMVLGIAATLIASVAVAWCVTLRDWPAGNRWLLAFAIAATLFALDLYLVPSGWPNRAFAMVHPLDAAEHARSRLSGFNKEAVAFGFIFNDGMVLVLAICTATLVSAVHPQRIPMSLICCWVATASAGLWLVYEGIAFALSVANGVVLTAAWYVILRHLQTTGLVPIAFTVAATCFMLFTHTRLAPEFNLYALLHAAPASASDLHHDRYIFQAIHRDCLALWFGGIIALVVALFGRKRPTTQDRAT